MKILVIGAGVLGSNITARFYKAGKDVTLLARGSWYNQIKENGLRIKSKFHAGIKKYDVKVIDRLEKEDFYDVIFVSIRFNQLESVYEMLNANCSKNIIFNGNNTKADSVVKNLPGKNVMFSFYSAAGKREDGLVKSFDMKKISIGDVNGNDNKALIKEVLSGTGLKMEYVPKMKDWLLCHAAGIIPMCFACYYSDGNLKKVSKDKIYLDKMIKACIEIYTALEKQGVEILPDTDKQFKTEKWYKLMMSLCKMIFATFIGKVSVSDHAMNAKDEMQALAEDLKKIMEQNGVASPYFDELWQPLKEKNKKAI